MRESHWLIILRFCKGVVFMRFWTLGKNNVAVDWADNDHLQCPTRIRPRQIHST
jgi:hypothetical protein